MLGVVRWLRYENDGGLSAGVDCLRAATAVGLRVLDDGAASRCARCRWIAMGDGEMQFLAPNTLDAAPTRIEVVRDAAERDLPGAAASRRSWPAWTCCSTPATTPCCGRCAPTVGRGGGLMQRRDPAARPSRAVGDRAGRVGGMAPGRRAVHDQHRHRRRRRHAEAGRRLWRAGSELVRVTVNNPSRRGRCRASSSSWR
jgi:hypothetical protein